MSIKTKIKKRVRQKLLHMKKRKALIPIWNDSDPFEKLDSKEDLR